MGTPTYTPLANITLGSSAATVTFSSISQAYRDLILVINATDTVATNDFYPFSFRVNGDTGSNYSYVFMRNYSTTVDSSTGAGTSGRIGQIVANTAGLGGTNIVQVMDYSATDKHKTILTRSGAPANAGGNYVDAYANRWASTSAITSLIFYANSNFTAGSTFALYGIAS